MRVMLEATPCWQLNSDTFQERVGKHTQISPLLCFFPSVSHSVYGFNVRSCDILHLFTFVFEIFRLHKGREDRADCSQKSGDKIFGLHSYMKIGILGASNEWPH